MNPWVLNASPLILFARIDRLDIVYRLVKPIMVPDPLIVTNGELQDRSAMSVPLCCFSVRAKANRHWTASAILSAPPGSK